MTEIKKLWSDALPPFPQEDIDSIEHFSQGRLFPVCACFWLFRHLHRRQSPEALLLGDMCFARFSMHLANVDSVELTNAFAAFLKKDCFSDAELDTYLDFIKTVSEEKERLS